MKIEEYRFRWGYEKSVQSGILKLKTSRIFYKNCKTFVFLPSLDTPKKNWGVPCPIACNRIWCTMSNTWHDLRLWANAVVGVVVFNTHSSRHSSLTRFYCQAWSGRMLLWSRWVECCCDSARRNIRHTNDNYTARCDWLISATTIAQPWTGRSENSKSEWLNLLLIIAT